MGIIKIGFYADDYQALARRTQPDYASNEDRLRHAVFGLCSESGEVAGILQKVYQGHEADKEHMIKELGDCLWMISEACDALDISLGDVMECNIEKLRKRYPDGFSAEKSLNRDEKDV